MRERRRYQRSVLVMYLHVFDLDSGQVLGYLADLSSHGLMLIGETPLPLQQEYRLGIRKQKLAADLHYVNSEEDEYIPCQAQSRWHHPVNHSAQHELYTSGFMFTGVSPESVNAIEQLIERIGSSPDPALDQHSFLDALLRLHQPLDAATLQNLAGYLKTCSGVVSISCQQENPHLLLVQYRRDRTQPPVILECVRSRQLAADLVELQH